MTSTLQFWDETNSAILFDVYDSTGANASDNGYSATFLAGNLDMGSPSYEFERFNPPQADGGSTTFKRMGLRTMTFTVSMRASSYDNYATAVGRLAQLCYNGGVLKWIPDGSANTRYIDYEPSPAPFYFDGRATSLVEAVRLFGTGAGITVSLTIQPTLRGAELDSATNLFTNATMLRDADGAGRPDGWSWSSAANITNETISATSEAFQFDIATAAQRSLTQSTAAASAAVGETWTLSGYARVTATSATTFMEPMLTWRTSAPADISTITGTLTNLTTAWQLLSVTGVAPATTDRIQAGPRMDNTAATSATVQFRNWKIKKEAAVTSSPFHVGNEVGVIDPEPTSGMGRVFPIYNPGDAAAPFTLTMNNTTSGPERGLVGFISDNVVEYLNTNAACLQFEDWTNGTDTAVNTAAASSPGSGNTGKKTTFVTANATRATYTLTDATTLTALRGRTMLALLRLTPADNPFTGTITLRALNPAGATLVATATSANNADYYDLLMGVITFPDDASFTSQTWSISANRTSGTGNLIWDCITFIPAPGACYIDGTGAGITASNLAVSNAELGTVFRTDSAGVMDVSTIDPRGPTPLVAPPGLTAVYNLWTEYPVATVWDVTEFKNARADVLSLKSKHKPRYLT